jgi:rare lipoprotein A
VVQAAAFSTADRAARAANVLGGEVSRSGQYFRVRTGPFATRGEAEASLAKVQAAGYRDARIYTSG